MWANDVITKLGNQTGRRLEGRTVPHDSHTLDGFAEGVGLGFGLEPGAESGWNWGWEPKWFRTFSNVWIWHPGYSGERRPLTMVHCRNWEVGTPKVTISAGWVWYEQWLPPEGDASIPTYKLGSTLFSREMDENDTISVADRDNRLRIVVHRWGNGKEALDDYDEWYTRFYVAAQELRPGQP